MGVGGLENPAYCRAVLDAGGINYHWIMRHRRSPTLEILVKLLVARIITRADIERVIR